METRRMILQFVSAIMLAFTLFAMPAFAGDLNPSAPPGPTMKTLDQIPPTWDQVLPAAERFKLVMGGAAVLDKETGLVWEQAPNTMAMTWVEAINYCTSKVVGNRSGWRLPSIEEVLSITDPTVSPSPGPVLPGGHPFNVQPVTFWSASTYNLNANQAWIVNFGITHNDNTKTSPTNHAWCVRGAGGIGQNSY